MSNDVRTERVNDPCQVGSPGVGLDCCFTHYRPILRGHVLDVRPLYRYHIKRVPKIVLIVIVKWPSTACLGFVTSDF